MADLKRVYAAVDEETALYELEAFGEKWNGKYPKIAQSWEANWPKLSTYPLDTGRVCQNDSCALYMLTFSGSPSSWTNRHWQISWLKTAKSKRQA